ncbi:MAG: DUF5979 domain-containing protein, partial [Lysobacteraceae bacterium]
TMTNPLTRNNVAVTITKNVTGAPATGAPGTYNFSITCANPTATYTGSMTIPANGTTATSAAVNIPAGSTSCTILETARPTAPANYTWGAATYVQLVTPLPVSGTATGTITNPLTANPASLTITKNVTGAPATGAPGTYNFSVTCATPAATYNGTVVIPANGITGTSAAISIPVGSTNCAVTEGTIPTAPTNYTWGAVTYAQPAAAAATPGAVLTGTMTNPLTRNNVAVTITKNVTGAPATGAPGTYNFSITCANPTATYPGSMTIAANGITATSAAISIPAGSTGCTILETARPGAPVNYTWGTATYTQPPVTLPASGTATGTITNPLTPNAAGLTVTKNVTGAPATGAPGTYNFSVTCATPAATYNGTVVIPANGTTGTSAAVSIPAGSTNCVITEGTIPTAPTNYSWGAVTYVQPAAAALPPGGSITGTMTNPLTRNNVAVTITKNVTGAPATGAPGTYNFSITCANPTATYPGSMTIAANGTTATSAAISIPAGSTGCAITEGTIPTAPVNYTWGTATYAQPPATLPASGTATGTITNPLTPNAAGLTVTKNVTGAP